MSDPDKTEPPVPPQKWKRVLALLRTAWDVASEHPDLSIGLLLIVAAFFLGRCTA